MNIYSKAEQQQSSHPVTPSQPHTSDQVSSWWVFVILWQHMLFNMMHVLNHWPSNVSAHVSLLQLHILFFSSQSLCLHLIMIAVSPLADFDSEQLPPCQSLSLFVSLPLSPFITFFIHSFSVCLSLISVAVLVSQKSSE